MDRKIVFVTDWGAFVGVNKGMIYCRVKDNVKWSFSPVELSSIVFMVNCALSTEVVKLANEYGIDLVFFDGSEPVGRVISAKYGGSFRLWVSQIKSLRSRAVEFAREFVLGKVKNQITTLRYFYKLTQMESLRTIIANMEDVIREGIESVAKAMEVEAKAARFYWRGVREVLPKDLGFKGRKKYRSGDLDPFNTALNIGYGILRSYVWRAVISVGLLPYVGFLHKFRHGRPSLVFDLMEEFRSPFVDRPLISLARKEKELIKDYKEVVKAVVKEINEEEILTQARRLALAILENRPYIPYRSK
ncbi:MAG: CRISPR-associated endonuclease Cas1 [Sulfolobaceae archaeon]